MDQKQQQEEFDIFAYVELFGHQCIAGRVTTRTFGSNTFFQVNVIRDDGGTIYNQAVFDVGRVLHHAGHEGILREMGGPSTSDRYRALPADPGAGRGFRGVIDMIEIEVLRTAEASGPRQVVCPERPGCKVQTGRNRQDQVSGSQSPKDRMARSGEIGDPRSSSATRFSMRPSIWKSSGISSGRSRLK